MWASSSSAIVTKGLSAFASHAATALRPFYPEVTLRTLFKLSTPDELLKFLIILSKTIIDPILGAAHTRMIVAFAPETVVLFACRTAVIVKSCVELEGSSATSSWAPRHRDTVAFDVFVK